MPRPEKPEGVLVFNYARSRVALPAAADIPTLIPDAVLNELTRDDPAPYYSVEAIEYPANGNGMRYNSVGIYEKSFFQSFIDKTKNAPIPGSKFGHEWSPKPSNDFYMVGGKMVSNEGDAKSGVAYFKMYIPPKGYTTENYGFIRDARAHLVRYSLVTKPEYTIKQKGDGVEEHHFTKSLGSERNDAVEDGAMEQVVNAQDSLDFEQARALIAAGRFDRHTKTAGDAIQNGIVYRSALRAMQSSRANGEADPRLAELISAIDKAHNGRNPMDEKIEALGLISNLLKNGQDNIQSVANALGFGDKLRTDADVANAETVKAINAKLGEKPLERLEAILAENARNAEATVKNAVVEAFGPAELDAAGGKKVANGQHVRAMELCKGLSGDALKNGIEAAKKDPIMIQLAAQRADGNSAINRHESGGAGASVENQDGYAAVHVVGR